MNSIAAGIVLYNPSDFVRFKKAFTSVVNQFPRVYVFDNSTKAIKLPEKKSNLVYITEHKNMGIAYALNKIMKLASKDGFKWVVTMDQDSIVPDNLIDEYNKRLSIKNVGIICPQVIDKRRIYQVPQDKIGDEYVNECITSGSCTSIEAWKNAGGFDEWLFIDLVDNDFCKRVILSGYKILQINKIILNQEFGNITPKSLRIQNFWKRIAILFHNENFAKLGYRKKVYPMRVYYTNRNIIYLNKKLKKYGGIGYKNYNVSSYCGFWIAFNLPSILRAKNKKDVIGAILSGIKSGRRKIVDEWEC